MVAGQLLIFLILFFREIFLTAFSFIYNTISWASATAASATEWIQP